MGAHAPIILLAAILIIYEYTKTHCNLVIIYIVITWIRL